MKHWETHPFFVDGCFGCKISTVAVSAAAIRLELNGSGPTSGMGTREYVRKMYSDRRAAGLDDPVPENSKAAAFAPAKGMDRKATGV